MISGLTVSLFIDGAGLNAGTATTTSTGTYSIALPNVPVGAHQYVVSVVAPQAGASNGNGQRGLDRDGDLYRQRDDLLRRGPTAATRNDGLSTSTPWRRPPR